jgi:hypothetical protein
MCLTLSATLSARSDWPDKEFSTSPADNAGCYQRISDTVSSLWLAHTNRMAIGRLFYDDVEQTDNLPLGFSANFPGRSRSDYLYAAGLWVGGIKGQDTLVSHAFDFTFGGLPELIPPACPEGAFQTFEDWADVEHVAVAYDTIIVGDTLLRCQFGDCNDWYPLGIRVTSHSYTWESPPFDRSVIVEYVIHNVDTLPIEKGWVGIYADCDVGNVGAPYADDVSGFLRGTIDSTGQWVNLNLAYSHDFNGDPLLFGFDKYSTTGAFGVQVLGLSAPGYRVNFNWWVRGFVDWGPRQAAPVIRDLGGSFASPYGDSNKYYIMSYPEVDYNQVESGLIHSGWLPPMEIGPGVASGEDTRFVVSVGPFDLAPGQEVTFTVAYVAGDSVITNPHIGGWFNGANPMSVSDYYELLRLDKLKETGLAALSIFKEGYDLPPPGPPHDFRLVQFDDTVVSLAWARKHSRDLAGYRLLEKAGDGPWQQIAILGADDTTVTINDLAPRTAYQFAVATFDTRGGVGTPSHEITIIPGAPHPPQTMTGTCRQAFPVLRWSWSPDDDVTAYRLYRVESQTKDTLVIIELLDSIYIDFSAAMARTYDYYVTAVTSWGAESPPSPSVRLVPLLLTSGILALNQNFGSVTNNLLFRKAFLDSLITRGLAGMNYTYRQYDFDHPPTIYDLARYSLIIVSAENRGGSLSAPLESLLSVYLANGGKVILILRYAATGVYSQGIPQIFRYSGSAFFSRYLLLDSSYVGPTIIEPGYLMVGDLVGAAPEDAQWPLQTWDSARVNQFGYVVPDGLPYCGFLWPREQAEIIYRYISSRPDSSTHGQVNGIRYKSDEYSFYLLNFPLSTMQLDSAAALLKAAVIDLNEYFICGDINGDFRFDIGDIVAGVKFLYAGYPPAGLPEARDVNCDGACSMEDVLILINFYLSNGLAPRCCGQ